MESRFRVGTPKKRINSSDEQVVKELFFELKRSLLCNPKALMLLQPLSQGERGGFCVRGGFLERVKGERKFRFLEHEKQNKCPTRTASEKKRKSPRRPAI
ncbi:unnamed protein product [Caretta caretta]